MDRDGNREHDREQASAVQADEMQADEMQADEMQADEMQAGEVHDSAAQDSAAHTHFDFASLPAGARYKLLIATVVPRPIAWVSTLGAAGEVNLAPYSFFGILGSDPGVVAFSPGNRADGTPKDTARNITPGADFTVNLVSHALAGAMNATATEFPPGLGEARLLGVPLSPGVLVRTPRVTASPAALECREVQTLLIGRTRIILGEVLGLSLRAGAVLDAEKHHVNTAALDLIGRLGGRGGYATTRDTFTVDRISYEAWRAEQEEGAGKR